MLIINSGSKHDDGGRAQLVARCPTPAWRSNRQEEARLKATSGGRAQYHNPRARKASHRKASRVVLAALVQGNPAVLTGGTRFAR
jgi:hypothetical protein